MPYGYEDVYRVLKRVRDTNQKTIGDEVLVFLDHYLNLIGTRFMNDNESKEFKEIDELCRVVYKKHRQALRLIWERVGNPIAGAMADAANVIKGDSRWSVIAEGKASLSFVPTAWLMWLPRLGKKIKQEQLWIRLSTWHYERKMVYALAVYEMVDAANRTQIVNDLRKAWAELGFKASKAKIDATWSPVSTESIFLELEEDSEPDGERIKAMRIKLDELLSNLEKLEPALKSLCEQPPTAPTAT